jgi:hypothetical protein
VFLKVLDAFFGVHHRKTLLFVNNYAAHLQGMSFMWNKIRVLSTELHEGDAFHKHWTQLDTEKDVNSVLCELNALDVSRSDELCNNQAAGGSRRGQ